MRTSVNPAACTRFSRVPGSPSDMGPRVDAGGPARSPADIAELPLAIHGLCPGSPHTAAASRPGVELDRMGHNLADHGLAGPGDVIRDRSPDARGTWTAGVRCQHAGAVRFAFEGVLHCRQYRVIDDRAASVAEFSPAAATRIRSRRYPRRACAGNLSGSGERGCRCRRLLPRTPGRESRGAGIDLI